MMDPDHKDRAAQRAARRLLYIDALITDGNRKALLSEIRRIGLVDSFVMGASYVLFMSSVLGGDQENVIWRVRMLEELLGKAWADEGEGDAG